MDECPRERDVVDAVTSARWNHRADPELVDHVAACPICRDVAVVAHALLDDRDAAWHEAGVPSSGQAWWRAEMRARQDAILAASKPITVAQGAASAVALALTAAGCWVAWPWVREQAAAIDLATISTEVAASPLALTLVVALGALVLLTPLALYLAWSDE